MITLLCTAAYTQEKIQVKSTDGTALVSVYVSVLDNIITTDNQGNISVPASADSSTIFKFEYLGFKDLSLRLSEIRHRGNIVTMSQDKELLEEIVIIGRTESAQEDFPNQIKRIDAHEIFKSAAQNSAEALELSGGAFVQRSQMGGGSPVLRGFEANKILLVVDGVRMNNAIYRNGHLQNAITVDPAMLDRMDIIFGAGSLLYGSEALGGVIHFQSRSADFNFSPLHKNKQELNAYLRYNSANHEKRIHADYSFGKKNWSVISSFSLVDFDDLRAGSNRSQDYPDFGKRPDYITTDESGVDQIIKNEDPNIQVGTAFSQADFMQKWSFKLSEKLESQLNIQFSTSSDIPRYDNLISRVNDTLRFAEWYYGPQSRFLLSHQFKINSGNPFFDKSIIIASFQDIDEDRISRGFNSEFRENQFEDIQVYGLTSDFEKNITSHQKLLYGFDLQYNELSSESYLLKDPYSSSPDTLNDLLSRYPSGGSSLLNMGAYVQHRWQNKNSSLRWINGLRYSWQNVAFSYQQSDPFQWPSFFYDGIKSNNSSLIGITGLNMKFGNFRSKLSSGTSFRSPNVDDLAKIRVNNEEITIPNPDLKAETVWNNEISVNWSEKYLQISATVYYSLLDDAIVRDNARLPDGSAYFVSRGDSLLVTANTNAETGKIRGLSLQMDIFPSTGWHAQIQYNLQSGQSESKDGVKRPLGHIPPAFGHARIEYSMRNFTSHLQLRYNGWKDIEDFGGSVDNPELATIDGSPSYFVLSAGFEKLINKSWTLNMGINNILDRHYRPFASGLSGPGRSIFISLAYNWKNHG